VRYGCDVKSTLPILDRPDEMLEVYGVAIEELETWFLDWRAGRSDTTSLSFCLVAFELLS